MSSKSLRTTRQKSLKSQLPLLKPMQSFCLKSPNNWFSHADPPNEKQLAFNVLSTGSAITRIVKLLPEESACRLPSQQTDFTASAQAKFQKGKQALINITRRILDILYSAQHENQHKDAFA